MPKEKFLYDENALKTLSGIKNLPNAPDDVVVVNDASTTDITALSTIPDIMVETLEVQSGPAAARNIGVSKTDADIIIFLDSDVVINAKSYDGIISVFKENENVDAVFGSYDNSPADKSLTSQYVNLRHYYYHQTTSGEVGNVFWTGFGGVRKSAFDAVGGFSTRESYPAMEDIELGIKLSENGCVIMAEPALQVKHLKKWTVGSLLYTDVFRRAIPWSKLIMRSKSVPNLLNVGVLERLSSVFAHLVYLGIILMPLNAVLGWLTFGSLLWVACANRKFYGLLLKKGGARLLLLGGALHWLYYIYSSISFGLVMLRFKFLSS